ncbi:3-keto-5-aminohexanoate cleavage protein [Mycolicibacterium goodii]|uniref:3-keto-5-aminohexanoate cleavage protein n=1 Tax=Mycolicibacterium goodii TaxID=134601 RepID=A0A0K0X3L3_MYCGD|nr:3-keto-5-aminohexanoate cleavage protein [Mycolicibacterium goodii]
MTLPSDRVIITVAPTGGYHTRLTHPFVPIHPAEIAADVIRCCGAGAGVAALHARRADGQATCSAQVYREMNTRIRAHSDIVLNNSTGGGINGDLLRVREDGSRCIDWGARLDGLGGGADICTLDAVTAYIGAPDGTEVLMDTPTHRAVELLQAMTDRGIKPEFEAFSTAHLTTEIAQLLQRGHDPAPHIVNIVLGLDTSFQNALPYTSRHLHDMIDAVPPDSVVSVSVNGEHQLPALTHALSLGAHVRVGIEDHGYLAGEPVENAALVERIVSIAEALGRTPASPAEARGLLGIGVREGVTSA